MNIYQYIRLAIPLILLTLPACSPKIDNRGYVNNPGWEEHITIGSTTRDEILAEFSSPSLRSSFGKETWYYVTTHKETIAFFKPEIITQNVVSITFDKDGVVSDVTLYDKENSKNIALAKRITRTEGHELGFLEQLIGNIGRFNKPGGGAGSPLGRQSGPGGL